MAIASKTSGSQTAVIDTEHTLTTQTDAGTYILVVDLNVLANGDTVVLKIKTKAKTGSTSHLAYSATYANVQSNLNVYSIPVPIDTEIVCTLEQTDGTGRTFDWNLLFI
jgi:hypothetical protein